MNVPPPQPPPLPSGARHVDAPDDYYVAIPSNPSIRIRVGDTIRARVVVPAGNTILAGLIGSDSAIFTDEAATVVSVHPEMGDNGLLGVTVHRFTEYISDFVASQEEAILLRRLTEEIEGVKEKDCTEATEVDLEAYGAKDLDLAWIEPTDIVQVHGTTIITGTNSSATGRATGFSGQATGHTPSP